MKLADDELVYHIIIEFMEHKHSQTRNYLARKHLFFTIMFL